MKIDSQFMIETFWIALSGVPVTLQLTFGSLMMAIPPAFFMAVGKMNKVKGVQQAISVYVSLIRGTPVVLQILFFYSLLPSFLNHIFLGLHLNIDIFAVPPILYAYIVFTLNTIATLTEVFRSALSTVNKGQLEAAQAVGLTQIQAYRRIIIPQAFVVALPNLCNVTVNLLKGTSLAFLMTVKEVTALAKLEASYGYNYIEAYLDIFIIYIILCTVVQFLFRLIEKYGSSFKKGLAT